MFDVIEGFKSDGAGQVTVKHAKRVPLVIIGSLILMMIVRFALNKSPLLVFNAESLGALTFIILTLVVDYLREIVSLRKKRQYD